MPNALFFKVIYLNKLPQAIGLARHIKEKNNNGRLCLLRIEKIKIELCAGDEN